MSTGCNLCKKIIQAWMQDGERTIRFMPPADDSSGGLVEQRKMSS